MDGYGTDTEAFAQDVRLINANAHTYNDDENQEICDLADDFMANFERLYKAWVLGPIAGTSKGPRDADFLLPAPWGEGCSICREDENDYLVMICDGCAGRKREGREGPI